MEEYLGIAAKFLLVFHFMVQRMKEVGVNIATSYALMEFMNLTCAFKTCKETQLSRTQSLFHAQWAISLQEELRKGHSSGPVALGAKVPFNMTGLVPAPHSIQSCESGAGSVSLSSENFSQPPIMKVIRACRCDGEKLSPKLALFLKDISAHIPPV